jgi:D-inositol-3-phosphate glycosyltransferase
MLNNILHVSYDIITNKYVLQTSAAIIATSKSEASQLLLFGIPKNKIRIIYPAEDIMKVKQQRKLTEFPRRIIFVGRINPIMQLDILIRAFSIVLKKVDAELWIVGPIGEYQVTDRFKKKEKYSEYLRRLSVDLQVSSRVHFSGFLTGQALLDTYSSSHLFVFLCPFGNYGRTLVEAAAFGLPIVCGRVGIATELVGNNDSGILVDEINDINVATAIEYILTDPKEYERMSRNALNNVTKFLDVKRMVKEHAQLYTEVLTAQYKTKSRF